MAMIDGSEQHLGRKAFYLLLSKKTNISLALFLVAFIFLGSKTSLSKYVPAEIISYIVIGAFLLALAVFIIGFLATLLQYKNTTFRLAEFALQINRGVMNKTEVSIPYKQIQDVVINRSLSQQAMGLSSLVMMVAGHKAGDEHEVTEVRIEPIEKLLAEEFSAAMQKKIAGETSQ